MCPTDDSANSTLRALALAGLILLVTLSAGGVAPAAGATQDNAASASACHLDRASPEAVVGLRDEVQQRLGELQRLNDRSAVAVDQSTIDTVANRMRNGNISYDRARYQRACGHYQIALDQSEAALERLYVALAEIRLASVEDQIEDRQTAGYDSMEMSNLSARHEALSAQTANVSSLSQARTVAHEAASLQTDTDQLPAMNVVKAADAIAPLWGSVLGGVGLTLVIGGLGVFVGRRTADPDPDRTTEGTEEGVKGTATRNSAGQRRDTFQHKE
jgi:hypothetical protein